MDTSSVTLPPDAIDSASMLELHYPHIATGLLKAWPSPEAAERFLNSILIDDRDNRHGLQEKAFDELMFLSDLNWKRTHFNYDGIHVSPDSFSFGRE